MTNKNKHTNYKWIILGVATIAQASACFFVQGIGPLAGFFKQDLALSDSQIGLLSSAAQLFPIIGLLIVGELLDRFSERFIVGLGAIGVSAALLFGVFLHSYIGILFCLFIVGAFYSSAQPGGAKSVASWFPKTQRGFAMGIRQAGLPLGGALAGISLPIVAVNFGLSGAFLFGSLISLIGGCIFIIFYRSVDDVSHHTQQLKLKSSFRSVLRSRLSMLSQPYMKNIIYSGIPLVVVQYVITIFIAVYFYSTYQLSLETSAYLFFIAQIFGVIGRIGLAAWSDHCRLGRFFPVFFCMIALVFGLGWLILDISHSMWNLTIISAWLGLFGLGWYGPWVSYIADAAPPERVGFALGLAMAMNQIAIIATPPIFGFIQDITQTYAITWSIMVVMLCVALFATRKSSIVVK